MIDFDGTLLQLRTGSITSNTSVIESPVVVPTEGGVELVALRPGVSRIQISLRTRYGKYSAASRIEIEPVRAAEEATVNNFTGKWKLVIGSARGKMDLRQEGKMNISGSYSLDTGDKGVIDGFRDGRSFTGSFSIGNSIARWVARDLAFQDTNGYIEIKGVTHLERAMQIGWVRTGHEESFYATIPTRE